MDLTIMMILVVVGVIVIVVLGCVLKKCIGKCCNQCKANRILEINKKQEEQITKQQNKLHELGEGFEDNENMMDEMDHRLDVIQLVIARGTPRPIELSEEIYTEDESVSSMGDSDEETPSETPDSSS